MTPAVPRRRRVAYYVLPSAFCLVIYWYALRSWFLQDDFTWLGLSLEIHDWRDFLAALFHPMAQGTVRVFSERVFFLATHTMFGVHGLPCHVVVFATQFVNLVLLSAVATRLTNSRAVGFVAPLLWTLSTPLATSLAWVSAYNQILCATCLLAALYCLVRYSETGRRSFLIVQWIVYLLGFGVLEIIVMYPALAALYSLCFARRLLRIVWPLFIPAALFTLVHFVYIPSSNNPLYHLHFDSGIARTFWHYAQWALAPEWAGPGVDAWKMLGIFGAIVSGVALAGFCVWQIRKQCWLAVFCVGWFVFLLLPVLPLRDHVQDYYLTSPAIGIAILGASAILAAWRTNWVARGVAVLLSAVYLCGSVASIRSRTLWFLEESRRFQNILKAVAAAHAEHPAHMLLLAGVDNDLFNSGFQDNPFRLFGVSSVYLMPGSESAIRARADLGGIAPFLPPLHQAALGVETGGAEILELANNTAIPATRRYAPVLIAEYLAHNRSRVDVGDPQFAGRLGQGWYQEERGFRWMSKSAVVHIGGPDSPGEVLVLKGYAPSSVLHGGPVILTVSADGRRLGDATIGSAETHFQLQFPLPASLVGKYSIDVRLEVNRTERLPGDQRDLGLVFGTVLIE